MTSRPRSRRELLQHASAFGALIACGLLTSTQAWALADNSAFDLKTVEEALKALGGTPVDSKDITITSPDIAENGAVVPIAISSALPKTQEIYIVVEKNPLPLTAGFVIFEGTEPFVSTRVKMGQSTHVLAIVKADGKLYSTRKETKVTLGGCGG